MRKYSVLYDKRHQGYMEKDAKCISAKKYPKSKIVFFFFVVLFNSLFSSSSKLKVMQSNFIEITLRHGCCPVNWLHIFRTPFLRNTSGWLLLKFIKILSSSLICSWLFTIFENKLKTAKSKLYGVKNDGIALEFPICHLFVLIFF